MKLEVTLTPKSGWQIWYCHYIVLRFTYILWTCETYTHLQTPTLCKSTSAKRNVACWTKEPIFFLHAEFKEHNFFNSSHLLEVLGINFWPICACHSSRVASKAPHAPTLDPPPRRTQDLPTSPTLDNPNPYLSSHKSLRKWSGLHV